MTPGCPHRKGNGFRLLPAALLWLAGNGPAHAVSITSGPSVAVTYHSATVTWQTDVASDSTVSYGTTSGAGGAYDQTVNQDGSPPGQPLVKTHTVALDLLAQNTRYYFQVASSSGTVTTTSLEAVFTTHTLALSNVQVTGLTDTSATVTWSTNDPALSVVRYGTASGIYDRHPSDTETPHTDPPLTASHSVTIPRLRPNTHYFFRAEGGYQTVDNVLRFKSPPTYAADSPEMSLTTLNSVSVLTESLTAATASAALNVNTDTTAAETLRYGTAPNALANSLSVPSGTAHSFNITGLNAGTTYYYATDFSGAGVAPRTTPVSVFITGVAGGSAVTFIQSTPADLAASVRHNVVLGATGNLLSLEREMVPGMPLAGPSLPSPRRYTGMVAYNGFLYCIGGLDNTGAALSDVLTVPINTDGSLGANWEATSPLPDARWAVTNQCFAYNRTLYCIGGDSQDGTVQKTVFYAAQNADGSLGPWQTGTALPVERDLGSAVALDGWVYLLGGETNALDDARSTVFAAPLHADGSLGLWSSARDIEDERYLLRAVANAHHLYVVGGKNSPVSDDFTVDMIPSLSTAQPNGDLTPNLRMDALGQANAAMDAGHYSMGCAVLGGKVVTVGGRIDTPSYHSLLSFAKLNGDGTMGPWTAWAPDNDPNAYPLPVRDNDSVAYNGHIYTVGGRVSGGDPTDAVVILPMKSDPSDTGFARSGSVESSVMDLGAVVSLQHLTVAASGGSVEVRYRFANTDGVFTDWYTLSGLDTGISSSARYFQYELTLTTTGPTTPTVNAVTLTAATGSAVPFTVGDVQRALAFAGGFSKATQGDIVRLDMDGDGSVTLKDAVKINRAVHNL